ncbi:MAG: YraN family protein [Firmicutes bacterium]|nr:YraN family protein [Bacillota bacterium]
MRANQVGRYGEDAALRYLEDQGYRLVERNFHTRYGELDLIMLEGQQLVFVEVKARTSLRYGQAEEAITWRKLQKMRQLVAIYLAQGAPRHRGIRLDAVAVDIEPKTLRTLSIRHYKNIG